MQVFDTALDGLKIIEPKVFADERGFFLETFQQQRYQELVSPLCQFVQDNYSRSKRGTLRGLHFQRCKPQGKLIRVTAGEIFDVVVDIRAGSVTFGHWEGHLLSAENKRQLWVPPGFAHGFLVLSEVADVEYKCTDYYDPRDEGAIRWNDADLAIDWPLQGVPCLSQKDAAAPWFRAL
ncbi:dTDP-4-dehydrorhamnose 3,5-epimerase [Pseudoalteromonas fenneropenaei]|uniref:dTDP-4-dehydrorhamnose 3,5-epimerase n=1 Tax=Pseudoalteromonas fenneropenaei TaxID=1737459 RepID=A0ABV7CNY6_9GAMM